MNQPMMTPPMPHRIVSQIGMLSLSPGATNLPSSPMMIPAMMTPMISMCAFLQFSRWPVRYRASRDTRKASNETLGKSGRHAERAARSGPKSDLAAGGRADLDVRQLVGRHEDLAAL